MPRLRIWQGYVQPLLNLTSDHDAVEILIDEMGQVKRDAKIWSDLVKWRGTLQELAEALRKDNEERGDDHI